MEKDVKTFQERFEAWKNGADYWKDIRGIDFSEESRSKPVLTLEQKANLEARLSEINSYQDGKDDIIYVPRSAQ